MDRKDVKEGVRVRIARIPAGYSDHEMPVGSTGVIEINDGDAFPKVLYDSGRSYWTSIERLEIVTNTPGTIVVMFREDDQWWFYDDKKDIFPTREAAEAEALNRVTTTDTKKRGVFQLISETVAPVIQAQLKKVA